MSSQPVEYGRKWYVMAAVAMGLLLATIDGSIVNVALPTLTRHLNTNFATVQWVILAYLLTQTTSIAGVGRLGDIVGKRPVYISGFIVFTFGSLLCGLAPTIYWLIGFRVIQAIGSAMILALGMAIVTEAFPATERGKAMGVAGTFISLGVVIGPLLGGILIDVFSWRWIFLVNLPVGIIGTGIVLRYVPDLRPASRQPFDYKGALTLFTSLLALLLALTSGQQLGFGDRRVLFLFGAAAIFLLLFVVLEQQTSYPIIDLRLFRNVSFSTSLSTGLIAFMVAAGSFILLPFYLSNVLGYTPRQMGLLLTIVPVFLGIMAPIAGTLSDRLGTRPVTTLGLIILTVGLYAMSTLNEQTTTAGYLLRLIPLGAGIGIFQSPNNSAIMGAVPRQRLGIASGLLSLTRALSQTTGTALLGALWASRTIYHAGNVSLVEPTAASALAQVAGLHDTFLIVMGVMISGLALNLWGLREKQRKQHAEATRETVTN